MKSKFYSIKFLFASIIGIVLLSNVDISAQTATTQTAGASPLLSISGSNYQAYCVEYTNSAPSSGLGYNWDTTPEDITNDDVTACLNGYSTYGASAVQSAIWKFTDNIDPSSGSDAWEIINRVNNGTYTATCASEWYPDNTAYQDLMTADDPHCNGGTPACDASNFSPGEIGSNQPFCGSGDADAFTSVYDASHCNGGHVVYQWQVKNTTSSNWINISGATYSTYNAPSISVSKWYRRGAKCDPCGVWEYSNVIDIHITQNYTNAGQIGNDECKCGGYDPATISNLQDPSGQVTTWSGFETDYIWQKRTPGGSWTTISGAYGKSFNPSSISETTEYRRGVRVQPCHDYVFTHKVVKGVNTTPDANDDERTTCPGEKVWLNVADNDNHLQNGNFEVKIISGGQNGEVILNYGGNQGSIDFTPDLHFCGVETIVYEICNLGDCGTQCCDQATLTVTSADDELPTFDNTPGDITVECDAITNAPNVTATDNCDQNVSVSLDEPRTDGNCDDNYVITRTWTAEDNCGNTIKHIQNVTVRDTQSPDLTGIPADLTVECDDVPAPANPTATDNCDSNVSITPTITDTQSNDGSCNEYDYVITRTWTAEDNCGNTTSKTQIITVRDRVAPEITNGADDLTVECDGSGNTNELNAWLADNGGAIASDNCDNAFTWSNNFSSLSDLCGETGEATVIFTVTDACDNSSTTTGTFTIQDTEGPEITASNQADNMTVECDGEGNTAELNAWLDNNGGAIATDECGGFMWSNDFDALDADCCQTGSVTVNFTATDDCGNSTTTTATFIIEDTTPPVPVCQDITVQIVDVASHTVSITPDMIENGSTDACCDDELTFELSQSTFAFEEVGVNPITMTVTDACGNEATCNANVTVVCYDLALTKTLAAGQDEIIFPEEDVTFTITVLNQGTIEANSIEITDYIPSGLTLNDSAWSLNGNTATYNVPSSIAPGASASVDITFTAATQLTNNQQIINRAEISSSDAPAPFVPVDEDSTADNNEGNDAGGDVNTNTDDSVNNEGGDEDDSDPEDVTVNTMSIGSTVFIDNDNNGMQDLGDDDFGIEGVTLELWRDGALVATTTTDANGDYLFDDLAPGDYIVEIKEEDNFGEGDPLAELHLSSEPTDNADNQQDGDDNGMQDGGSGTEVKSPVIVLSPNDEPTNESAQGGDQDAGNDDNGDMTVDFGFVPEFSIGSNVFVDANNNGTRDAGEEGIEGILVEIFSVGPDGIAENGDDVKVGEDTTDANGDYFVGWLKPGDYYGKIMDVSDDYPVSSTNIASSDDPNNDTDGDDNGLQTGGTGAGVWSNVVTLSANDEPTNEPGSGGDQDDALDDDNGNMTLDFGFIPQLSIGSNVFVDANDNGVKDADEDGIEGILVEIFNTGADGIAENADDEKVGEDVTDANGDYFVGELLEGDYYAKIMTPDTDYPASSTNIASSEDPNNNTDGDDNGLQTDGSGSGVWSNVITLSVNDEPTNEPGSGGDQDDALDDDNGNMTLDFGFKPELSIGSNVFYDANDNGVRDADEDGIEGILVEVFNTGADGIAENGDDEKVGEDTTDANGDYFVGELLEGDYYVKIMNPSDDYPRSSTNVASSDDPNNDTDGDDNGLQTGGTGAGVWSNVVSLTINDEPTNEPGSGGDQDDAIDDDNGNMTVDFGFRPELSIGSNVYSDTNNNGVRDAGEPGIEGVLVEVFNTGADGIAENADDEKVGEDVTDANGDYFVGELLEGDYYAKIMDVDAANPTSSTNIASSDDPNNNTDGDDNGLQTDGSGAGVWSNVITLSIDDEPTNEAGSGGDQDSTDDNNGNMTLDFGFNRFDLALNKTLNASEDGRVYPGEDITFDITVFNQGNVDAYNVLVTDYIPAGLTLNDGAWAQNGSNATFTIAGPLAAGSSETISITLTVATTDAGDLVNSAEITSAEDVNGNNPEDVDSDADADDSNDAGGEVNGPTDDTVDNENGDEDDQDPEDITVEIFDLALIKTLSAGSDDRIYPGETVSFDITVTNQGTVPAQNIVIEDYAPVGLTATGSTTLSIAGPLAPGASQTVTIEFTADPATTGGQLINVAEIASAEDELGDNPNDLDSTPDSDPNNDAGGEVNGPTDDTVDNENGDEDDSDPEDVFLEIFDLALVKTLAAGEDARVYPGETVSFDITVTNQGSVPASNIVVEDFGAPGLTNTGSSTITLAGPLAAGASETVQVTFTVDADAAAGISTNIAEIQSSEDDLGESPNDNDSTEDSDPNNDPTEDNAVDGENGDEDDNDPEDVDIQIFDLALRKTLAAGEDARVYPGETVTFTIEVFNQGTVAASNIVIEDYVPAGLTANGATTLTIAGPIAPGASESVDISFVVSTTDAGTLENGAEIQSATDDLGENPEDIDSTPDGDDSNDPTDDNSIDGENGDEDDDDIEPIEVEVFDLASNITLAPGEDDRVYPGETVSFKVTVFNQGTVSAENIDVTLMIPNGLTSVDGIANMGTINFAAPLAPGEMTMQILEFVVGEDITSAGELIIKEEISSAQDEFGDNPTDIDSTPDADFTNDAGGVVDSATDDTVDNEQGDEDDNDPENVFVEIFDLALIKTLSAGEDARVYPGETVSFDITVTNQGSVPASDILITDYVPAGLTANGPSAITIAGPLAPGASEVVSIEFTVDAAATDASLVNRAEITDYRDDLDERPEDIDSVADADDSNDTEVNDVNDNTGGDEDDADLEELELEVFDLALTKQLAAGEDERVYPGETVTFTIEVTNQGTVPASNVVIEDYAPAGLTATGATSLTIAGPIAPGASESVDISFVVATTDAGTLTNGAEIQSAEDDLGDNPEDNDSTADNDPDNDPTTDDAINGENGDEDDDDVEDVEVEVFDLASNITLAPGEDDRVFPGETVSFKVTVFNQGTVSAENIDVTLMIPDGLTSVDGIANMGTINFAGPLAPGDMTMQILEFVVNDDITSAGELVIKEEISSAQDEFGANPTDIDSTPDADFTNDAGGVVDSTTDDTVDNEEGDEDDNDPENVFVEIFDLALSKTLSAGEDARVYPGDAVSFDITVTNQGSVPATNIVIEDYVPAGLTATSATTITLTQLLQPGESATVPVTFTVNDAATAGTIVNRAEITSSVDDLGNDPEDIDSVEDADDSNDVEVNDVTDNTGGDEDDADLEELELEVFDLALIKTLAAGEDARVYPGETVTFTIEVTNQGSVPASNVVIQDYVPAGLTANGATSLTIAGPIAPGASESVDISFTVSATTAGTLENGAEIQSAEDDLGDNPDDNDSTPDGDADNDPTVDNEIDNGGGDEDDADIEPIDVEVFDLASNITLAPGEDDRVYPGETVSFKVTVFNQGTVSAENIDVTLMIPDGLTSVDGIANMGTINFAGPLAPGEMTMQILEFVVGDDITSAGELVIKEEISSAQDEFGANPTDIDSTPDADFTNDAGGVVDSNTDDTVDNEQGDEDDNDPENVFVEIFDLALTKKLAAGEDVRVYPGETVTFTIEVTNQGSVPASNVVIEDYVPAGLTATGATSLTIAGPIAPGASESVDISFVVSATDAGTLENGAEIQSAEDDLGENPEDIDSTPDADDSNDPTTDDAIDGENGDEDDADIEPIEVEVFDLASTITLAPGEDDRVYPGETVSFKVTVFNQGTVSAENIDVTLMIPDGLTSVDGIANMGTINFAGPLAPGEMTMQILEFVVADDITSAGELVIKEEISSAQDEFGANPTDSDSTPDDDFTNDAGGVVDSDTDDTILNENGDEDDNDPENVFVEIFDLALRKTLAAGEDARVYPGETVTFTIEVFNQGSVAASNIVIEDYVPAGLTATGATSLTIAGPLAPGASESVDVSFVVSTTEAGTLENGAEIQSAEDDLGENPEDIDSTPDGDDSNDNTEDNAIDGENGDEDDADIEPIDVEVFDLASNITLAPGEDDRVYPGETVSFKVTVFNQGTVSAENIDVTLMIPDGLTSVDGIANMGTINFAGPLAPGDMTMQILEFVVADDITSAGELVIKEEITSAQDEFGANPTDIDSTPDADFTNDAGGVVDSATDDTILNENGDEDDNDPENVFVEIFDLALTKTTTQTEIVKPGEDVTFTITVLNQGSVAAENIQVIDYLPNFLALSGSDTNGWTTGGGTLSNTIAGPLAPGASTSIDVVLTVGQGVMSGTLDNFAEIIAAQDEFGDSPEDVDSTPDSDNNNDSLVDNEVNNAGGDEDDHDIETIEVCDDVPPVLAGVPSDIILECSDAIPALPVIGVEITATDFSNDEFTITVEETSTQGQGDDCSEFNYEITRVWTVVDVCDNSSSATQVITIQDTTAPAITTEAADMIVECDGQGNVADLQAWLASNGGAIAEDNCSEVSFSNDAGPLSDECGMTGSVTVNFTAIDECGNTTNTSATFTIEDTTAPTIDVAAADQTVECDGSGNLAAYQAFLASNGGAAASDVCSENDVTWTNDAGQISDECGATGFVTVNFTATDDCGNTAITSATFTIEDTIAPVITDATDETVECDGQGNLAAYQAWLAANGGATATDDCSDVTITNNAGTFSDECGATGFATVTFTATDDCGNSAVTTATFTIEDTTAPVITTSASDEVVECDGQGNVAAYQAWLAANAGSVAEDACSNVTFINDAGQFSDECGATGFITVNFTAIDDCGNTAVTSATFTIEDTTAPVIDAPASDEVVECDGQGNVAAYQAWLAANAGAAASDACSGVIFTNDAGQFSDECGATGFITVNFTATDDCGNTATTSATFTIEDTTAPVIDTPAANEVVECDGQGNVAAYQAWLASNGGAAASDACSNVTFTNDAGQLSDECGSTGFVTATFTATDDCGNTATTSATFTIEDTTAPVIDTPAADEVVECDGSGNVAAYQAWLASNGGAAASDACSNVTFTNDAGQLSDECGMTGFVTATFTATDDCGNTATTTATFSIEDTTAPDVTVDASDLIVECDGQGNLAALQGWLSTNGGANAVDGCGEVAWSNNYNTTNDECGETGAATVTFVAVDECGNTATTTASFVIEDTTAPVISNVPVSQDVECDEVPAVEMPSVEDACDNSVSVVLSETTEAGACPNAFVITRIFTATDACGNSSVATQTINVGDSGAPMLSGVPSDTAVECDEIPSFPTQGDVTATDNCDPNVSVETEEIIEPGACQENYTIVRRWIATDACGNSTVEEQRIEVGDNTAPVLAGVPTNITVECDEVPNTSNAGNVTANDNCDANVEVSYLEVIENADCADAYTIVRTWIASDNCGNESSAEQRITVGDNTAPLLVGVPSDLTVECDDVPSATNGNVIATDNCDPDVDVTFIETIETGACADAYVIVRTWTATDNCGNETSDVQRIEVGDNTAPIISGIPANLTLECDEVASATNGNVLVTDNCDSDVELTFEEVREDNGVCENAYTIRRTWIATDNCGNASTGEQLITVGDNTDPVLTGVPADLTVECDAIPTDMPNVQATDNCDADVEISLDEAIENGACQNSYVIVKTWTATDNCGNATSQQQRISVEDTTAPVLSGVPSNTDVECGQIPNSNGANDVTVSDNCDANPLVEYSEIIENNGACADAYTIVRTWTATDDCGNVTSAEQRISVGDTTSPVLAGVPSDETVECDEVAPLAANVTAVDNCDPNVDVELSEVTEPGNCANSFVIVRTWIATDNCGNTAVASQRVNVGDNTAPVISGVDADITIDCGATPPAASNPQVTDNCDANVQLEFVEDISSPSTDCTASYDITRTWTATDDCGNATTATQVITVSGDNTAPTLVGVPADINAECSDANIGDVPNVTATDNCDPNVSVTLDELVTPGACEGSYSIIRTWIATDDCGNTATATQTVNVSDVTAPTIVGAPADLVLDCGDALPQEATLSATDNCDDNVEVVYTEIINGTVDCQNSYDVTRTWTAIDDCGNSSVATQIITITGDNTAPTLVGVPSDVTFQCGSVQDVPQGTVSATDNCDPNVTLDYSEFNEPGACPQEYTLTRTWIATDACGNSTIGTQTIFVGDSEAPILIGVPADENIECGATPSDAANVTAIDNCSANVTVTFNESAGNDSADCTASFTIVRTWTATDECGNEATATQTITVGGDTGLPTLVGVPADVNIACNEAANIPAPNVTATDDCDAEVSISMNEVINPGNCPGAYVIVRTWTATDDCGNSSVDSQTINVNDADAPVISGVPGDITLDCGESPDNNLPSVTATDNCDTDVAISFDETRNAGDCSNTYTLVRTWTASDDCGNVSTVTQTVFVGDNEGPVFSGVPNDMTISCTEVADFRVPTATDNCGEAVVTFDDVVTNGACASNSTIFRTYTATDECGNATTLTQTITVSDNEAPVCVGVPSDITVNLESGQSIPDVANVIATDNCDPNPQIDFTSSNVGTSCDYVITRTWTLTDDCGNAATCTQNITVVGELDAWLEFTRDENCDEMNGAAVFAPESFNYAWSDGGTGSVREDLADGTYTVTATDDTGCSKVFTVVISEIGNCDCMEPAVSINNITDATCGEANGSIELGIANAGNYTYTWIPNIGTGDQNIRTGLPGGLYEVVISDLNFVNCFSKVNFVIGNSDGPDVTDIQVTPASCGDNNGSVVIAPASYTYMWMIDNFIGNTRSDLAPGIYEVTAMDPNNPSCPTVIMVEVTGTSDLDASANIIAQPSCGAANGSVQIAIANGSTGITYAWNDGATGDSRDNLSAGSYTVVITDANGCQETLMFVLMNDVAGATIAPIANATVCFGEEATVTIDVTTDAGFAGTPVITIVDENGVNAVNGNLTAGGYCAMVADANGCIVGQSCFDVIELPLLLADAVAQNATCTTNGSIDLTISGGAAPYSISWSNGVTSEDLTDLDANQYTATITDANGCIVSVVTSVANDCNTGGGDCELDATVSIDAQPTCDNADGAVTITINTGTASTVAWPDGSSALVRTDLAEGNYTVTITDATVANCVDVISVTLTDDADCDDGGMTGGGNGGGTTGGGNGGGTTGGGNGGGTTGGGNGGGTTGGGNGGGTDPCDGSLTELTSDCEGQSGYICLDIPKSMFDDYTVAVDGTQLQEASVLACNFTTIIRYDYSVLLDGGFKGPYQIDSWVVNGVIYSGTFQNILEILDFMNDVDPTGNWMIDRTRERLLGGNPDNNYGDFFIDQLSALNSQVEMGVNTGTIAMGSAIGPFDDGVYTITVIEPNATCPDTILLTVTCMTDTTTTPVITDVITVNTTVATPIDICTDNTPLANVASVTFCGGPQGGSIAELTDGCFTYTPGPGLSAGDSDQLCITVCDDAGVCVETTVNVNILDENATPCDPALDILGDDLTIQAADCGDGAALCTDISVALYNNYDFTIDGTDVTTMATCGLDTVFNYSYFNIADNGFNGIFTIDAWTVGADTYTGSFTSPAELTAFMNANDATGIWTLNENSLTIEGGDLNKSYGMIEITRDADSREFDLQLNSEVTPNFVAFELSEGSHTIIATDVTFGCADTLNVIVECPVDPTTTTPAWSDSLHIVLELNSDSLYCYPLATDIASVEYTCLGDNSGSVTFSVQNNCILIDADMLGTDIGCFTICDVNGECGELLITTEVLTEGQMDPPVAMDDDTITLVNIEIGTVDVLINDINIDDLIQVSIVSQPQFGTVVLNGDNTFTYIPNPNACGMTDEFQYMITTAMGSDIATVFIDILCEELTPMSGFSPNGDNINDTFTVLGIERFPNNEVIIFNRWGNQVYEKQGYSNADGWRGTWDGQDLPDGTYFFIINTGEGETVSGYVQIQR